MPEEPNTTQEAAGINVGLPPLEWNEEIGKGIYSNLVQVVGTDNEVVLDFGLRTIIPPDVAKGREPAGRTLHVARIILPVATARELRNVLDKNLAVQE